MKGKKPDQDVFDKLDPTSLNKHLNSLMPGLSAKVFRTYNASVTLENELPNLQDMAQCENVAQKVAFIELAPLPQGAGIVLKEHELMNLIHPFSFLAFILIRCH